MKVYEYPRVEIIILQQGDILTFSQNELEELPTDGTTTPGIGINFGW